jgi:hypothetical protein
MEKVNVKMWRARSRQEEETVSSSKFFPSASRMKELTICRLRFKLFGLSRISAAALSSLLSSLSSLIVGGHAHEKIPFDTLDVTRQL